MALINNFSKKEIIIDAVVLTWLLFVFTNSSIALGTAYQFFAYAAVFFLVVNIVVDRSVRVTYQKKSGGHFNAILAGGVGWVVLLAVSYFVLNLKGANTFSIGSIISSLGAANPVFSNSQIINFITISFAVAYAETMLWARGAEFIADLFKIQLNKANKFALNFLILAISLSILFSVFHFTSKGVGNTSSLIIIFFMMLISLIMISYYDGETRQAVWLHIIANSVATLLFIKGGGILTGVIIPLVT